VGEVDDRVEELSRMAEANPDGWLRLVRGWVVDPTPLDTEALGRPEMLVELSAALRHIVAEVNDRIRDVEAGRAPDPKRLRGMRRFRDLAGYQKNLAEERVRILYPDVDVSTRLRARAKNILARRERKKYLGILRDLQEQQRAARAAEKAERRARRAG
jgi:hypothetical protein